MAKSVKTEKTTAPEAGEEDTSHLKPNAPPEITLDSKLEDLELEASNWLDDEPLTSQEQADKLTDLVDAAKGLLDEIEQTRKAEKEPFLIGGREVDAKFKPLAERAEKATRKLKNKIGEWLRAVKAAKEREKREAEAARREAERRLQEEHERNRQSSDLADDAALAAAEEEAKQARITAAQVKKTPVAAVSSGGGAVRLRKVWLVNIQDRRELLQHYLRSGRPDFVEDLEALLRKYAEKDVRQNGARVLPGCSIWDEDRAV